MTTAGQMTYGHYGATLPTDARGLQKMAYDTMSHSHKSYISSLLYTRFDDDTAAMYLGFLSPVQNPLRRIANLLSVTYTMPTYRTCDKDEIDEALHEFAPDVDTVLGEAERTKNGMGDSFVVPFWNERRKRISFNVYPPHRWDVKYLADGTLDYYEFDETIRYYTDGTITRKGKGDQWESKQNLFGVCPVVWFRLNPYASSIWSIEQIKDLIYGTAEIGLSECLNNLGEYYRSFKQPFLINQGETAMSKDMALKSLRIGADTLLARQIGTVDLADPANPHYDQIRKKIIDLAATRGISDGAYFNETRIKNAEDAAIFTPELRKIWRETIKYQLEPERDLLKAIIAILAYYKVGSVTRADVDLLWRVDYREPVPEGVAPLTSLEILRNGIELGVDNAEDYLMRMDRECVTRAQARAKILDNAEVRAAVNELMIERNTSGDPSEAAENKTPQENGADGGRISGQVRAENNGTYDGKNGPPIVPKNI